MRPLPEKVLFLLPSLDGGGAQRVFSILLQHLDRATFEPHLAVLQARGPYLKDIPSDVVVHELKVSHVRYAVPGLVKLVRKVAPRTVLSTLGHMNLALTFAKPLFPDGTRLVIRESAIASMVIADATRFPRLWLLLYRIFYPRANSIICLCDAMVEDMATKLKLPRQKLVRVYNPVDIENLMKLAERGATPYAGPGPHLLAAGRLSDEKGFDLLVATLPAVRKRFPQATLTILGEGPRAAALSAQVERLGLSEAICFAGFRENPWPYFKHASVFVLASRYEGLPNVALEALALGASIVATDCPGAIRELQGLFPGLIVVPPENAAALADGIISVCDRPALCAEDRLSALSKFSVSQIVSEYSNLLLA